MSRTTRLVVATFIGCAVGSGAARAAEEPKRPWTDSADFGLVLTTGNSESTNFAFGNKFKYAWSNAELTFDAAAIRNENTTVARSYDGVAVTETETTAVTAANYGLGYVFVNGPRHILRGEAGFDYTREDPLGDPIPGVPATDVLETTDYASLHLFLGYEFKISDTAKLTEDLNLYDNLDTTSDWRASSLTAVTASLTSKLAVKVSYTILYDNEPPFELVPDTVAPIGPPTAVPFEKTDTILAAALVVNF